MSKNKINVLEIEKVTHLWTHKAVVYLGLDRLGLTRPDMAIHRLVSKGV